MLRVLHNTLHRDKPIGFFFTEYFSESELFLMESLCRKTITGQGGLRWTLSLSKYRKLSPQPPLSWIRPTSEKKPLPKKWRKKTAAFDRELDSETEARLQKIRAEMEVEMDSKLSKQKSDANSVLTWMEKNYENHHTEYVMQLFQSMIKE